MLLGRTGIRVSRIAIGGLQAADWPGVNGARFISVVDHALEHGLNLIDTAATYGDGRSEETIADAIQGRRDRVVLATKFSFLHAKPADIRLSLEQSLRRLRTDYIDLFQQHWPSPDVPVEDTIRELERLKAAGKIRAIGVSNWMEPEWEELSDPSRIDSLQPCYSLLWRSIESRVLPLCRRHNISVFAYSPLCQGVLAGRFLSPEEAPAHPDDLRAGNVRLQASTLARVAAVVAELGAVGAKYGKTAAQTALRWVLDQPGITSAIVGVSSRAQVDENLGAAGWHMDPGDWQRLAAITWPLSASLAPYDTPWGWHSRGSS